MLLKGELKRIFFLIRENRKCANKSPCRLCLVALWDGESLEFTHTKCSFLCASKWNVLWNGESLEFTPTKKYSFFFVLQNGTAGLLFDQQENRKRLAHDIFDTFAKYAGLVYDVTDVD